MTGEDSPEAPSPAVELRGVEHRYGGVRALVNVSLSLPARSTIGFVGPDGVGKSTLLSLVAGVKKVQLGQLRVLGADMRSRRQREATSPRIAFMPQGLGRNLYPTLSVYENIDFFGRLFGQGAAERAARIRRLLRATGLSPFADRPAGKLSGGMKQKLGLCCSLVHDPKLLILDEPTTGVDPLSRRQFWDLIEDLRAENSDMTVMVATAYMEEAERFEYLVAIDAGRILISDVKERVFAATKTASVEETYTALLPENRRGQNTAFNIPPYRDPGGESAIEAENLTQRIGDFTAVDHVNFKIRRGEIFGFLGSNGCGKTTTMKMLTGLLDATSGSAKLLGKPVEAGDMATRLRIGYMSQAFSLYEELTVRQNLVLHARLYRIEPQHAPVLVDRNLTDFTLKEYVDELPSSLPLGVRQRLQLAAACLHTPEVLILDEPTSGVDPGARDMFWRHLVRLSRENRVTIFVSTHFMNEAERCDRISLMHRGRVLAVGAPTELTRLHGSSTLEDAFIALLEKAQETDAADETLAKTFERSSDAAASYTEAQPASDESFGLARGWIASAWAFAWRETIELIRDRVRLAFAIGGPIVLLCIGAYSVSFDVENIRFSAFDQDRTHASREFVEHFQGSHYFVEKSPAVSREDVDEKLRSGTAQLVIEIPPEFGRDLEAGRLPEVVFFLDGATPFIAANIRAYATGVVLEYVTALARAQPRPTPALPIRIEPRFVFNQDFRSIYATAPSAIMLTLILIPAMLTALGIVREKEIGSIINLYASPASIGEFLIGKQLPYVALAMASYLSLVFIAVFVLAVPLKGSFVALSLGALLFLLSVTALGLLISTFVRSQVAAIFGTAILCLIPSVNFSGLLYPVSTLSGASYVVGLGFPASWFQLISLGCFTKGLGVSDFLNDYFPLLGFALLYLACARVLLRKQES